MLPPNLPRAGAYVVEVEIPELPLQPDTYALDIGCRSGETYILDYIPSAFQLENSERAKNAALYLWRATKKPVYLEPLRTALWF